MSKPTPRTLADLARLHATGRGDHTAMVCEGRRIDYATLYRTSKQVANGLRAAGLRPGDRLAYLGKESECFYELLFGAAKAGVVVVPINWRLSSGEVEHILRDSGSSLLFVDKDAEEGARRIVSTLPGDVFVRELDGPAGTGTGFADWVSPQPDAEILHRARPDDAVVQMYTSGTTGLPKGVVLAHRSFFAVRNALATGGLDWIDWHDEDRNLASIAGFHIGGLWWAVQGFAAGVTNVLLPAFYPADAVAAIREHGVTTTCMVPAMMRQVLAEPDADAADFTTLRKIVYGGSPIAESLMTECIAVFGCELVQIYGLTESGNTALCLPPAEHVVGGRRMQAAGRPYPGFEVAVLDADGNALPPGEVGAVALRSPAVMLEYWNLPDATAETLVDGWLHTGDAGYLDEDGFLFIRDRIKDMIIVGGENVYPAEIENVLCGHPAVSDAAVVGVPDERWGEAVHAFIVVADGEKLVPAELALYLQDRLAPFKVPRNYETIATLPRNPSGKILRRELRKNFWHDRERAVN